MRFEFAFPEQGAADTTSLRHTIKSAAATRSKITIPKGERFVSLVA
jgi:hypothetical protein